MAKFTVKIIGGSQDGTKIDFTRAPQDGESLYGSVRGNRDLQTVYKYNQSRQAFVFAGYRKVENPHGRKT